MPWKPKQKTISFGIVFYYLGLYSVLLIIDCYGLDKSYDCSFKSGF